MRLMWAALLACALAAGFLTSGVLQAAGEATMADYPKKTGRTLHTDAELAIARQNIERYPAAASIRDSVVKAAEKWADWSDEGLASLIIPPQVPRAFNISFSGCPVHGREAFKFGNYSFSIDLNRPFKVKCPVGGEEYPSNDFAAFLATGMKDRSLLTGPYPDDGWGWKKPGEEKKYWFVAYYNHWAYYNHVIPAALNLSRAYLLTGNPKYAHQAIILSDKIADVYPAMDHNKQSRYAAEFAPTYTGKIVNMIWETNVGRNLSEAYDNVWEAIDRDQAAQKFLGKTGAQMRANIEKNLVREVIECVYSGRIRGNFGMHQDTLLTAAIVAQAGDETKVADYLLNNTGGGMALEGYNYAIANYFTREGISCRETAPGYCLIWPTQLVSIADMMKRFGISLFAHEKVRNIMVGLERMILLDKFTPATGDSGGVTSGAVRVPAETARIGYREYQDDAFADILRRSGSGGPVFSTFDDLFAEQPPVPLAAKKKAPPASDLMDSYGLALLRSPKQPASRRVAWSLFYGPSPGHGHADKLNIDLYALDHRLLPDLGYPQFAADDPEPPGWSRNTVCHNTVIVNAKQQTTVEAGRARTFAASPTVQLVEVDAPNVYKGEASLYRRTLAMIEGRGYSYGVDVFRVAGGKQHDYSLHGPDGDFSASRIDLSPPQEKGTLAGQDVPYAFFYDDPTFAEKGERQGYYRYRGSGFSFLTNVQRAAGSKPWSADWRLRDDAEKHVRITWLPQAEQTAFVCDGKPPLRPDNPEKLKYILSRREGAQPLASTFVSVIEPYEGDARAEPTTLTRGAGEDAVAIEVKTPQGTDLVAALGGKKAWAGGDARCTSRFGVISADKRGALRRAFVAGRGEMSRSNWGLRATSEVSGRVVGVDYSKRQVAVRLAKDSAAAPAALPGSVVRFSPPAGGRVSCFFIKSARRAGRDLILTLTESPDAGLVLVSKVDDKAGIVETKTFLPQTDVERYNGMTLADETGRPVYQVVIAKESGARITVERLRGSGRASLADTDNDGRTLGKLYEFGPGDAAEIAAVVHLERGGRLSYTVQANAPFQLALPMRDSDRLPSAQWQPDGSKARAVPVRRTDEGCAVVVSASALGSGRGRLWTHR
jgi:hypothetical protein